MPASCGRVEDREVEVQASGAEQVQVQGQQEAGVL